MQHLIVHGVIVPIRPSEVSDEIWDALTSGSYEAKEARWISRAIRPNDRVLELGTGLGIITSLIASIEGVRVWSFEPNPETTRLAKRVIDANCGDNVAVVNGLLAAGAPRDILFYMRSDLWMSSTIADQGPYERVLKITSSDVDAFVRRHRINALVMDIEGAELDLLQKAELPGIERVFLELHDHLYGLTGVRNISDAMAAKGFIYDPRGSSGPCVLFSKDDGERHFDAEIAHAV